MARGSVRQIHLAACPRRQDGSYSSHRCRGNWQYQLDLGRDANGKRIKLAKAGFATKRDAERALTEARERVQGHDLVPHRLTVRSYLKEWLEGKRAIRPTTLRNYKSHIDHYINPTLGDIRLADLRVTDVERLLAVTAQGVRGRDVSAYSVRRVYETLRSALSAAVRRRLIAYNPAIHIDLPALPRRAMPVWSIEEVGAFFKSSRQDRLAAMYRLVMVTGLRRGELLGLRWADVDLESGVIRVVQQLVDVNGQLHFGPPKTRRSSRVIPLDGRTVRELRAHGVHQAEERLSAGPLWADHDLIFCRVDGSPLRPEYATRHFQLLTRRAGLDPIRFHDLRHTSASLALEAGVPMKVVSDRLGHSSTAITADLYTHVSAGVSREAAQAIAAVLDAGGSATPGSREGETIMPGRAIET